MIYIGAAIIGILLGLMGSGGSILTVPVLLYLVGHSEKVVFAESMAIVGIISAVAVIPYTWSRTVCWLTVLRFGIPGVVGTYFGAAAGLMVNPLWQLLTFAGVLGLAAWLMLRRQSNPNDEKVSSDDVERPSSQQVILQTLKIAGEGLVVGAVTGFVGVGGGFLIVPALVLLGGLKMQRAVATSLVVIVLKSMIGFYKYQHGLAEAGLSVSWETIGLFSIIGILGSFLGRAIGQRMPQEKLRFAFGIFLVLMGVFVIYQELSKLNGS
ncbi:MAG: sulfite exporter TauE/SafE family protein [Planctomycetaceae bacterium]|nr:sulfite exporter TauE/SafE family protein [Planctomycetaceae bacterium]